MESDHLLRQAQDNHKGQLEELSACVLLAGEMVLNVRSSGSGSLPHYSADKHTIVQMSGEQRLLLLPPAAHRRLRPFPKVRKRVFSRHLYIEMIILPRQARDNHRENSKQSTVFLQLHPFAHHSSLTDPADPTLVELLRAHGLAVTLKPGAAWHAHAIHEYFVLGFDNRLKLLAG